MLVASISWEAVTAIGTLFSGLVIAVTVVLGLRQLFQLRRATQLDGTMRIYAAFADPKFIEARSFVFAELPARMKDPAFVAELRSYPRISVEKHPELIVLNFLNMVGSLVRQGSLDGASVYEYAQYTIVRSWEILKDVVREQRVGCDNPYMWGMAELLYDNARDWIKKDAQARGITRPSTGEPFDPSQLK